MKERKSFPLSKPSPLGILTEQVDQHLCECQIVFTVLQLKGTAYWQSPLCVCHVTHHFNISASMVSQNSALKEVFSQSDVALLKIVKYAFIIKISS